MLLCENKIQEALLIVIVIWDFSPGIERVQILFSMIAKSSLVSLKTQSAQKVKVRLDHRRK